MGFGLIALVELGSSPGISGTSTGSRRLMADVRGRGFCVVKELLIGEPEKTPLCPVAMNDGGPCLELATNALDVMAPNGTHFLLPVCPDHWDDYGPESPNADHANEEGK